MRALFWLFPEGSLAPRSKSNQFLRYETIGRCIWKMRRKLTWRVRMRAVNSSSFKNNFLPYIKHFSVAKKKKSGPGF